MSSSMFSIYWLKTQPTVKCKKLLAAARTGGIGEETVEDK
jgi:hypothetical protein